VKDAVTSGRQGKRNNLKYVQSVKVLTGIHLGEYKERLVGLASRKKETDLRRNEQFRRPATTCRGTEEIRLS
jgi:hypothetical protein